jgi:hypothetical protein
MEQTKSSRISARLLRLADEYARQKYKSIVATTTTTTTKKQR